MNLAKPRLVLEPKEVRITLCPDSLRFWFFMSLNRRNSARDKVIGKK